MIAEIRKKSQITIPADIIKKLGLSEGDALDIAVHDGVITLTPLAVYPKSYMEVLKEELGDIRSKLKAGEQSVFDSVDELFSVLDE